MLYSLPFNVNVILLNSLAEDNIGAHNTGTSKMGHRLTTQSQSVFILQLLNVLIEEEAVPRQLLLVLRRLKQLEQHLRSTLPQVVLHSLPFNLDIILLHTAPPQVVLTAKPTELMVERVLLRGLLLVLRSLAANASG